ncbi:MAG: nucleotidyl transferase AbiEii/AbiGii toxin family protein [Candidatus Omnitrophota bacterium]
MKEIALQITRETEEQKLNILREYLQSYVLFLMQKVGMSESLYFIGGTALRFLYRIRRYSEDLDFSAGDDWIPENLKRFVKKLSAQLERAGYLCAFNVKEERAVQKIMIGFVGLLYEAGLTNHREQKLTINLEIDLNPPAGWSGQKTIVDIHMPVVLQHYDLPSLYAGKLHAFLMRSYTKGRDVFDLFWYRTKQKDLIPNLKLLNNAIQQTHHGFAEVSAENWLHIVGNKVKELRWDSVRKDIVPFLEYDDDLLVFTKENLMMLFPS